MNKICKKCNTEKSINEFHICKTNSDGVKNWCKICCKEYNKQYSIKNRDKLLSYYKVRYESNKDKFIKRQKAYYQDNKDKKSEYDKKYYSKNSKKIIARKVDYVVNKLKTDLRLKLSYIIRDRVRKAIKSNQKSGSAIKDLGCTIQELKTYLESKFQSNMSWDNYGIHGWHIDHIRPLSSFDLSNPEEFKQACHYTNLQPLWAIDNLKKGNRA